ncbi:MAG: response regulator [Chloroflexota bacterium]
MPGILVVDDLPVIRTGIIQILTQYHFPLQPYLEAADGQQALQMARTQRPEIILMDIKMPVMDGLQAARQIRAEMPDVKVVMLTAYNEFSYIQKAMKLGTRDYLLKPVRPAKLVELLEEIQKEINEERRSLRTIEIVKDSLQKTLPLFEATLVENLIRGAHPEGATTDESLAFLGKRLVQPAVIVAKIDGYDAFAQGKPPQELQQIYLAMVEIFRRLLPEPLHALVGYSKPGRVIAVLSCDGALPDASALRALADRMRLAIRAEQPFTVTIGVGSIYTDWEAIPLSYAEANLARRYQSHSGGDKVVHIDDTAALGIDRSSETAYRIQHEQDLMSSLQANDQARALKLTNEVVDYLTRRFRDNLEGFRYSCGELVTLMAWAVIGSGIDQSAVLTISHDQVLTLNSQTNMQEIRTWTNNCLAEFLAVLQGQTQKKDAVSQAVEYLRANYQRADISLQDVADAVCLSKSYLAAQFREMLGVSYVKYLTQLRIDEARRLLRTTDLSIAAIAEKVGYPNLTNFYRHFQNLEGKTPSAYRQLEA